jgi:hypothetical protein
MMHIVIIRIEVRDSFIIILNSIWSVNIIKKKIDKVSKVELYSTSMDFFYITKFNGG